MSDTLDLISAAAKLIASIIEGLAKMLGQDVAVVRAKLIAHPEVTGRATDAALDDPHLPESD